MGRIRIGTSGWSYPGWHGPFYPADLPTKRELEVASRRFDSLEVNRSFYSLLTPASCRAWYEQTPPGFVFALKGSRFITHAKKLVDVDTALANYFASGVLALEDKLGPIVWQLSRAFVFDGPRLAQFFAQLPKTTADALALARRHDERTRHGAYLHIERSRRIRHVLEPRHASFATPELARLARRFGIAIAVTDSPDWPRLEELTTGFVYVRLHGSEKTYASAYSDDELDDWARRVHAWSEGSEPRDARRISTAHAPERQGRDVYVYFDNDNQAHAPHDAERLRERLQKRRRRAQRTLPVDTYRSARGGA